MSQFWQKDCYRTPVTVTANKCFELLVKQILACLVHFNIAVGTKKCSNWLDVEQASLWDFSICQENQNKGSTYIKQEKNYI